MARYDFRTVRLFVEEPLSAGRRVALDRAQANYLRNVMRLPEGAPVLVFNGRDGEWRAAIEANGRKNAALAVGERIRAQSAASDLHYAFAPLKHARLDYMVQKATELGVSRLQPVFTRHSQAERINLDRMRANAIEAAEQCGILTIPDIAEPKKLDAYVASLARERLLVFCDEDAETRDPVAALSALRGERTDRGIDVLIGPEGGFADDERVLLLKRDNVVRLSLGPRILRADSAAVAALSLVQATLGDWR